MCRIYNPVGSWRELQRHFYDAQITDFKTLRDVLDFENRIAGMEQEIIARHRAALEAERLELESEVDQLKELITALRLEGEQLLSDRLRELAEKLYQIGTFSSSNFIRRLLKPLRRWRCRLEINRATRQFERNLNLVTQAPSLQLDVQSARLNYLQDALDDAIRVHAASDLLMLERKKKTIENYKSLVIGAIGEEKVVETLAVLSDEYFLINDFSKIFERPIYHSASGSYIQSIQADHVLVGPQGIFLIETKNWSQRSIESIDLRSPVEQVKRTGYALFRLLNDETARVNLSLRSHHWGNRRLPVRSLIVMINKKPFQEFQFVKVLSLHELVRYIQFFEPLFTTAETGRVAGFLQAMLSPPH